MSKEALKTKKTIATVLLFVALLFLSAWLIIGKGVI